MSIPLPPPDPLWTLHLGLLGLQAAVLVLTVGIFVTTMVSAYGTLSLLRRTLRDIVRLCRDLEERVEGGSGGKKTRMST